MKVEKEKIKQNFKAVFSGEEIDLKLLLSFFWSKNLIYIGLSILFFGFIGYLQTLGTQEEYAAKCVLLGEQGGAAGSSSSAPSLKAISSFLGGPDASGAGSDVGGGSDLYQTILSSNPFLLEAARDTFYLSDQKKYTTLEQYFKERKLIDAERGSGISRIIHWLKRSVRSEDEVKLINQPLPVLNPFIQDSISKHMDKISAHLTNEASIAELTSQDQEAIGILKGKISLKPSGNTLVLSVLMPKAKLSAEVTMLVLNKLIKYVTKFQTGKQLETFNFLEARKNEAEIAYKSSQQKVAGFKDNNYNVIFESVKSREQQLQNEFSLTFNIYNQFATQLEQARIQLKKETPLFTVLEPVYVPANPENQVKSGIVIKYMMIGAFIGIAFVVVYVAKSYLFS